MVVFWSTTCSHCLVEVPQLYEFIKDNSEVKVFAIALENDELGFNHYSEIFDKWTNILGLDKWQNKIARDYQINATPNYFILDANKKIISKPYALEDVKNYFNKE
jgi:thiol-disulfide isomerase/thioredoxin